MNKKLIALVSSVAFILTPATSVLAEGNDADTPSAENNTEVVGEESPENHTESNFYFNSSASSKTAVSVSNKNITFAYQDSLDNKFIANLVKKFNLKNIVDAFDISDDYVVEKGTPYTVTFSNPAVYKDGHVYRIHHYHYDYESDSFKAVKEDTVDYTAKDGKITVTLHGASPILVEDVTPATNKATTKAQGSKAKAAASSAKAVNGRKAALNTGVRY